MRRIISLWLPVAFLFLLLPRTSEAQTTYTSTFIKVDIGVATKAKFCFGPVSSPCIGQTVVFVNYPDNSYQVVFNYATPNQQGSAAIPLTYSVTRGSDPDHDSNQLTSVVVTSAQSGTVGGQTVTLNNGASFQSEQVGRANQNETLGGSATLTITNGDVWSAVPFYPCGSNRKNCLQAEHKPGTCWWDGKGADWMNIQCLKEKTVVLTGIVRLP